MSSPSCPRGQNVDSLCLISLCSVFSFARHSLFLSLSSPSLSLYLSLSLAGLLRVGGQTDRVFDWGGDAIIALCTGLALFSSSDSLLCFRCAHLPGFPLLMEFLKHGIMRGVNQDRENQQFSEKFPGGSRRKIKRDLQRQRMYAYFTFEAFVFSYGKLWRSRGNLYQGHSGKPHMNFCPLSMLSLLTSCTTSSSQETFSFLFFFLFFVI